MTRRAALAAALSLLILLVSGYAAAAQREVAHSRHMVADGGPATPSPVPPVPATPPVIEPSPDSAPPARPAPRGSLGPLDTKRLTGVRAVALTFDDGPHPDWTPKILDQLRAARVKATFCVVGREVRRHPALVVRMVREGHTLCNHSWAHDLELGTRSAAQIRADLARTNTEIRRAVPGVRITYYRQPGGKWTPQVIRVVETMGMIPLHWDVDPADWRKPKPAEISKRVSAQARPGSIVLLHDGGGDRSATLAASPEILSSLRRKYGIVRLT